MTTRREVLTAIAAIPAVSIVPKAFAASQDNVETLLCRLETALYREVPGLKKVQVNFDPQDKKVPLSVVAFRV